jgi:tetratricopeptide (TPR) repeat protein
MAAFIANHHSNIPIPEQWRTHLQRQEYVSDVTQAIRQSVDVYNEQARHSSEAIVNSIRDSGAATTQAIGEMADDITEMVSLAAVAQIEDARRNAMAIVGAIEQSTTQITDTMYAVGRTLDFRLNTLIDQQRVGNLLLNNIAVLLRIPDFQKERHYFIEQGFKHYHNAAINSALMTDALENLLQAEAREKTDYIVLHRIGMIYLYSPAHVDLSLAKKYFIRAAQYAAVESNPSAQRLADILSGALDSELASQKPDPEAIKRLTADAFLQGALTCYLRNELSEALEYSAQAIQANPSYFIARFNNAKFLAASGHGVEAAKALEPAIRADRNYAASAADDGDLAARPEVRSLLQRLRDEAAQRLQSELAEIKKFGAPFLQTGGDRYSAFLRLEGYLHDGYYLSLLVGLDELPKVREDIRVWRETLDIIDELGAKVGSSTLLAKEISTIRTTVLRAKEFHLIADARSNLCLPPSTVPDVDGLAGAISSAWRTIAELKTLIEQTEKAVRGFRNAVGTLKSESSTWAQGIQNADKAIAAGNKSIGNAESAIYRANYVSITVGVKECEEASRSLQSTISKIAQCSQELDTQRRREAGNKRERAKRTTYFILFIPVIGVICFFAAILLVYFATGKQGNEIRESVYAITIILTVLVSVGLYGKIK